MAHVSHIDDLETVTSCDVCSGTRLDRVRICREKQEPGLISEMRGDRKFPVLRCEDCGLGLLSPRYRKEKLMRLYSTAYFDGSDPISADVRRRYWDPKTWVAGHRSEAELFRRYLHGGGVLDAGCGAGLFADALGPAYRVTGVDWSERGIELARTRSSCCDTFLANIEEDDLGREVYDGAVMIQVLDHLRFPTLALRNVARALRSGGVLLISRLINFNAPFSRLFRDGFRLLAPNHLYYFTRASMLRMLEANGFGILTLCYPFLSTGAFSPFWFIEAPSAVLRCLVGAEVASPPGPGNLMTIVARKL